ncbi:hypothetical protein BM532_18960, partial [Clostridioides difficile]
VSYNFFAFPSFGIVNTIGFNSLSLEIFCEKGLFNLILLITTCLNSSEVSSTITYFRFKNSIISKQT